MRGTQSAGILTPMKALAYRNAHALDAFSIAETEVPLPDIGPDDLLVRVRAISVNPVDYKIRSSRSWNEKEGRPVILGWDVAGTVDKVGGAVAGFQPGDEVYYAGALLRDGGNAEYQAVDHRIVALKPKNLGFPEAAALPLTMVTAWEALLERRMIEYTKESKVLVIGGAGGVGSAAIQLLKAKASIPAPLVIATASRPETETWCKQMGADLVVNHRNPLTDELKTLGVVPGTLDVVFGTTQSAQYLKTIPDLLRPFGHFCLIDDPGSLDIVGFKRKSISVHWEWMFAKTLFGYRKESQGRILNEVTRLVEAGKVKTTANRVLRGFSASALKEAHTLLEAGTAVGKIVIDFGG